MLFKYNNTLIEINKDSYTTDIEFYEAIMNIMSKITNTSIKNVKIYKSTTISNLLKQNSANHKN